VVAHQVRHAPVWVAVAGAALPADARLVLSGARA
jgi:hypothetical protein